MKDRRVAAQTVTMRTLHWRGFCPHGWPNTLLPRPAALFAAGESRGQS